MKNLESTATEQLLSIIPDHPGTSIMQFANEEEELALAIRELCREKGYNFQLNLLSPEALTKAKENLEEGETCSTKMIKWEQRRYASMAKLYYNIFITTTIPSEKRETFLNNVLNHIKTAGHIIFFLPKGDRSLLDEWWELLEEKAFVSISTIDVSENYEILVGKKMHGWDSY